MSEGIERRALARSRTLKKGKIVFRDRYCSAECVVRNESPGGALLMVSQNHVIPRDIEITIYPGKPFRPAGIVWRTPDAVCIRFMDVAAGEVPSAPDHAVFTPPATNTTPGMTGNAAQPLAAPSSAQPERRLTPDRRHFDRRNS